MLFRSPEALAGSTRLGAATAQKVALNMISTLAAIQLGHVHDGMMVNLFADNAKLRKRAAGIVCAIADVPEDAAKQALNAARGNTKLAVLLALGSLPEPALKLLSDYDGHLRPCIAVLKAASQS